MQALDPKFTKTYKVSNVSAAQVSFKYTTMVRHKGTVIAFAMDNQQRIYYSTLNLEREGINSILDSQYWDDKPQELRFPAELTQTGYSAAGVQTMPIVKKNGAIVSNTKLDDKEKNLFLSTTARLTADAPFQVLSDDKYVYVFRQAIHQEHPYNLVNIDQDGNRIAIVDQTLLCDRFVMVGGQLKPKLETRFQRSRNKDLPADRKDSLGYEDLEKKPFYEPTQELTFVGHLIEGRFSVVLIPTSLPDVQRWQIFAYNSVTQRMDSFNIARSDEGLFNTRGTRYYTSPDPQYQTSVFERRPGQCPFTNKPLIEIVSQSGFAESALALNGVNEYVAIPHTYALDFKAEENFTLEVWLKAEAQVGADTEYSIVDETGVGEFPFAIRYLADGKLLAVRSDGSNTSRIVSSVSINDAKFHHVAFVKQELTLLLLIDGAVVGTVADATQPATQDGISLYFGCRGGKQNFFKGQIDEVRLWRGARSQVDLNADRQHRLVGNEINLAGYWRCDEGAGTRLFDQTDAANHGQLFVSNPTDIRNWVRSEAPVGEHPGIRRSSFEIDGRRIAAGCTALLYYQQEQAETGYTPSEKKPIKRNARVMLAVPTVPHEQIDAEQSTIAVLDFAVSRDGGLAQIPDHLSLKTLDRERIGDRTISDILDSITRLEQAEQDFTSDIREKTIQSTLLRERLAVFPLCNVAFSGNDGLHLFLDGKTASTSGIRAIAESQWRNLPADWAATGLDAIVSWGLEGLTKCYIFKGNQCLYYDAVNHRLLPGYSPRPIKEVFSLPTGWSDGIDAAIRLDPYNAYFFKGDRCLLFNGLVGQRGENELNRTANTQKLITEVFPGVPSSLKDVDEVWQSDTTVFFFKGAKYVSWHKDPNRRRNDPPSYKPYAMLVNENLEALLRFSEAMRSSLQSTKNQLDDQIAEAQYNRQQTQQELSVQRQLLQSAIGEVRLEMPLLHTDPAGLTLSGAVLGFAWSNQPPLLFESVNGRLSLYFRGQDGQFFAAYYDILAGRSIYTLEAKTETDSSSLVRFIARSAGSATQSSVIQVSDSENPVAPDTCTVRIINQNGITETWNQVPKQAQAFADVLNGAAQPVYVGKLIKPLSGTIATLDLDGQAKSKLSVGATLLIGPSQTKASVQAIETILRDSAPVLGGTVLELDGENDYIQLADAATLGLTDRDFTVEAWISVSDFSNPNGNSDRPVLGTDFPLDPSKREPNKGLHLTIRDGKPRLGFYKNDLPGSTSLVANTWYHIAWRYKKATQEQAIFVNGKLDSTKTERPAFLGTTSVNIGRWDSNRYFKGYLGEVRIWSEARSLEQLRSNMNRRVETQAQLTGYWRFEAQGNQVIARDYSQYGRHGIVKGNPQLVTVDTQALRIQTTSIALDREVEAGTSIYCLPYDYAVHARTNKLTHSLNAGSLSFRVDSTQAIGKIVTIYGKQIAQQGAPATANYWFTDSQNTALRFGEAAPPLSAEASQIPKFAFADDLTLEAWVNHGAFATGLSKILHYNSGDAQTSYALGLFRNSELEQFGVVVGIGDRWVKTTPVKSVQQWRHIAAVFQQSYALKFSGTEDVVNCGNDATLDIPEDLTIEAFIRLDHLQTPQAILTKGRMDDGTHQDCAYSLYVDRNGRLVFAFEDKDHGNQFLYSPELIQVADNSYENFIMPGQAYRIAVTRKYNTEVKTTQDGKTEVKAWFDVSFYASRAGRPIQQASGKTYAGSIASNNQPLEIGQALAQVGQVGIDSPDTVEPCYLKGEISEVRLWNTALPQSDVCKNLNGDEKGLVSWWRFEENQGTRAADSKSSNHGTIANATWIKSSDVEASRLTVYINGESVLTTPWTQDKPTYGQPQFSIGGQGNQNPRENFQGQLDEIRIWNIARTEEQIQDNLFRRVMGDFEHLLAYYNCDAGQVLQDDSGRLLHLPLSNPLSNATSPSVNYFVLSTAPISNETAQVRNALAQVKTPFHATIDSAPAVQEYGDLQVDSNGNSIGIMKRCYAYIKNGSWHLITGYKVSDLELEWIGQAQYEPQLVGFIEGAPPVPSENLTIRDANQGEIYDEVSVVELTEADQVMYTYAASKETAFDTSFSFKLGLGVQSETLAGIGLATSVEKTHSSFGLTGSIESSSGMLREQQVSFGKGRAQVSRLKTQGAWEDPTQIQYPEMGRRYVPKNVGFALVKSKTADIFALRVKHRQPEKRVTIALSVRPNPDIPEDWNIITFPINPRYTKQGTLDGRVGLRSDQKHYPNAKDYGSDLSYFKPIEAYALKTRIEKEQQQLTADYENYGVSAFQANRLDGNRLIGPNDTGRRLEPTQTNLFNTYVWTADGGLFAETQNAMSMKQEVTASLYSLSGMVGGYLDLNTMISKASVKLELESLLGGHLNLVSQKSDTSQNAFGVTVELDVERDISIKSQAQAELVGKGAGGLYDADGNPVKCPGKVDGYRFMTFYLQPDVEHFKDFQNKVVDRAWLDQSADPNAVALRQATTSENGAWRVLHRVTYVSRVLPEVGGALPISTTDAALRAANIESNWELIKTLDPFVKAKSSSYAELKQAVEQAIDRYLPELAPAKAAIVEYMSLYYQVFDR